MLLAIRRLVHRQYVGDVGISLGLPTINVSERLPVGVLHFIAARYLFDCPRRRETASAVFRHEAD